jgi:hypothetical protein
MAAWLMMLSILVLCVSLFRTRLLVCESPQIFRACGDGLRMIVWRARLDVGMLLYATSDILSQRGVESLVDVYLYHVRC